MQTTHTFPLLASLAIAGLALACGATSDANIGAPDGGSDAPASTGDDGSTAGDDGGTPSGDGGVTLDRACGDWAQARCARLDACSNATFTPLHYGDQATCIANSKAQCATDLAATQTAATPSFFEACASAIAAEACVDSLGANPPAACAPLAGPIANGAPCLASSQCASTYCAIADDAACGACAAAPKSGDACVVAADCGGRDHLTCSNAGTCIAFAASGAACNKDEPCGVGLSCVGATKNTPGACAAAANTVGATCSATHATGPGCDNALGLTCDPTTSKCVAESRVGANQACGALDGGLTRCEASGTCVLTLEDAGAGDAGASAATGTCLAAAANGAACDLTNGPACVPPAKCVSGDAGAPGTCELADPSTCR